MLNCIRRTFHHNRESRAVSREQNCGSVYCRPDYRSVYQSKECGSVCSRQAYDIRVISSACLVLAAAIMLCKPAFAGQETENGYGELDYLDGQKIYYLLPQDHTPEEMYPSVYFMPQNGYDARQCIDDGVEEKIRSLEQQGLIPEMIYVFPELCEGIDTQDQIAEAIRTVEENCSVIPEASMRGVLGTGAGGYLAFLTGYSMFDGQVEKEPKYFSAIASLDGDFTSEENPYIAQYGDLYGILGEYVDSSFGADTSWLSDYYTYIDGNSDSVSTWADGGSADMATLYRSDGFVAQNSPSAWDYSVFEYSLRTASHYGSWMDHLERPLHAFSVFFGLAEEESQTEDETETEKQLQIEETVVEGEGRMIDLMGDWHFCTVSELNDRALSELNEAKDDSDPQKNQDKERKSGTVIDANSIEYLLQSDWESWDIVQPGLGWWTEDFADCLNGNANYVGYAWYVREFNVPEGFDVTGLQIEAGMIDEADEVYLNGVRVGQTGIREEGGGYDGSNPWEEERIYMIPDDLLHTGSNLVAVRMCNGSGGGGWYSGPIRITAAREKDEDPAAQKLRFYVESFEADSLRGQEIEYRVYLPEGYYESNLRYPVVYMLHGYGSTGKSFEIAGVADVLDEGIASGDIPPCIVIFPTDGHPQKASWWSGAYATMLTEDLIAQVDGSLRTVDSREYRFLAGESMGGGGAYLNALKNPKLYGGVFDIYGDLRDTGALKIFLEMDADQLSEFRHYSICGNHDMYEFDLDHILMGRHLTQLQVPHVLEIDNGEHSSSFYLPYLKEGFAYLLEGLKPVE